MSSEFFKNTYKIFASLQTIEAISAYYEAHDFQILNIPIIRLQDMHMWRHQWSIRYDLNMHQDKDHFSQMLSRMGIFSKEDFLQVLTRMFHEILSVEGIHFDQNDDISVVFCKKDIKELIAFCNTISIHAGKNVKEFTLETCHDSVYYFRATKENGYGNQIRYNQMMKDMCFSFLDYLEEQPYGKA